MKHLKSYNETFNYFDYVNDLKDILLEMNDIGFSSNAEYVDEFGINLWISRLRSTKGFIRSQEEYDVLKDVLHRIKVYADINKLDIMDVFLVHPSNNFSFKRNWDDLGELNVYSIINKDIETFNQIMDANRFTISLCLEK